MGMIQLTDGSLVNEQMYNAAGGIGYAPRSPQPGLGTVSNADRLAGVPLSDNAYGNMMQTEANVQTDITASNPLNPNNIQYDDKGNIIPSNANAPTGIGFNTQTLGAVAGLGQLGLGYLNYKDAHKMNKQTLAEKKFNLGQARKDAAIDADYRASYGV